MANNKVKNKRLPPYCKSKRKQKNSSKVLLGRTSCINKKVHKDKISCQKTKDENNKSFNKRRLANEITKEIIQCPLGGTTQLEAQVVECCARLCKKLGLLHIITPTQGVMVKDRLVKNPAKGFPDAILMNLQAGKMVYIEYKRNKGGVISPEQQIWHERLRKCGQTVWVICSRKHLESELEKWLK